MNVIMIRKALMNRDCLSKNISLKTSASNTMETSDTIEKYIAKLHQKV